MRQRLSEDFHAKYNLNIKILGENKDGCDNNNFKTLINESFMATIINWVNS
jgi:hypothetical protein